MFNVAGGLMLEHPLTLPFIDTVVSSVLSLCLSICMSASVCTCEGRFEVSYI